MSENRKKQSVELKMNFIWRMREQSSKDIQPIRLKSEETQANVKAAIMSKTHHATNFMS